MQMTMGAAILYCRISRIYINQMLAMNSTACSQLMQTLPGMFMAAPL